MEQVINKIIKTYYPIYFVISLSLQSLLFYLILTKTSKVLRNMRWFLYPSNFANMILASATFFLQVRNVSNTRSQALLCQGPCKYLGREFCWVGYNLVMTATATSCAINIHTLYYRMVTVKHIKKLKLRILIFCVWYLFPVVYVIISYIPPNNHDFVYSETLQTHPTYDYEPYKIFGGFADSHSIYNTSASYTLISLTVFAPLFGYYWRRETLKILDKSLNSLSKQNVTLFKALIRGLLLQLILPLVCYIPVEVLYIYNKYSASPLLVAQYTLGLSVALPAIIDPIFQIYFIVPYRKAVKSIFTCAKSSVGNSTNSRHNTPSIPHLIRTQPVSFTQRM